MFLKYNGTNLRAPSVHKNNEISLYIYIYIYIYMGLGGFVLELWPIFLRKEKDKK
jgi:hypothetical protein